MSAVTGDVSRYAAEREHLKQAYAQGLADIR